MLIPKEQDRHENGRNIEHRSVHMTRSDGASPVVGRRVPWAMPKNARRGDNTRSWPLASMAYVPPKTKIAKNLPADKAMASQYKTWGGRNTTFRRWSTPNLTYSFPGGKTSAPPLLIGANSCENSMHWSKYRRLHEQWAFLWMTYIRHRCLQAQPQVKSRQKLKLKAYRWWI